MKIIVNIDPEAATTEEFAVVNLDQPSGVRLGQLDVEYSRLAPLRNPNQQALDFLLLASTVYALDKLVPRKSASDCWTREFVVSMPVFAPEIWTSIREELTACLGFLTGDIWSLNFRRRDTPLARLRSKRHRRTIMPLRGDVVCLFSGGLDSLIGAIDWLESHRENEILLVGHHDAQMTGPLSDQHRLQDALAPFYRGRANVLLVRVGHHPIGPEITLRSRSLVFVALGIYAASSLGPNVPLLIPENGTIAINVPLTPSRRGSCSTRTAHPYYLKSLGRVLAGVGLSNQLSNPLEWKTKGEAVAQCRNQVALEGASRLSVSCAKRGHKKSWRDRSASGCGRCMPCIYRRASLHGVGLDDESYGNDICKGDVDISETDKEAPNDLRACFSFLRRRPSQDEIARMLLASGSLDVARLPEYAKLVDRAMDEVRALLRAKGTSEIRRLAGLQG